MSKWTTLFIALAVAVSLVLGKHAWDRRANAHDLAVALASRLDLPKAAGNGATLRAIGNFPHTVVLDYASRDPALSREGTKAAYIASIPVDDACTAVRLAAAWHLQARVERAFHRSDGVVAAYEAILPERCGLRGRASR